jgi:hypothetical protein
MAPVVAVEGVKPVVPALKELTPEATAVVQDGTPLTDTVRYWPFVPTVNFDSVLAAEAYKISPVA